MCDCSLEMYASRPAREFEKYVTTRFPSGSIGVAASSDCRTAVCNSSWNRCPHRLRKSGPPCWMPSIGSTGSTQRRILWRAISRWAIRGFNHFRLGACSVARGRRLPCLSNVRRRGASVRRTGEHGTWAAYPYRGCSLPRSALSHRAKISAIRLYPEVRRPLR
jgi:hypothetical protein